MTTMRSASCSCGQLSAECEGEPVRVSMCHCLNCQRRTGSPFAVQARWPLERVHLRGEAREYTRVGDEGGKAVFRFCGTCGDTLYWINDSMPDLPAFPVGVFADPTFPPPTIEIYRVRKHPWVATTGVALEQYD